MEKNKLAAGGIHSVSLLQAHPVNYRVRVPPIHFTFLLPLLSKFIHTMAKNVKYVQLACIIDSFIPNKAIPTSHTFPLQTNNIGLQNSLYIWGTGRNNLLLLYVVWITKQIPRSGYCFSTFKEEAGIFNAVHNIFSHVDEDQKNHHRLTGHVLWLKFSLSGWNCNLYDQFKCKNKKVKRW